MNSIGLAPLLPFSVILCFWQAIGGQLCLAAAIAEKYNTNHDFKLPTPIFSCLPICYKVLTAGGLPARS